MRPSKKIVASCIAIAFGVISLEAKAAPFDGSNVDTSLFSSAIGSTAGWSYLGQNTSAFTGAAGGTLELRSASFSNSFGYSQTNHTGLTTVFNSGAVVGTTSGIVGYSPSYLFFFKSDSDNSNDDNTQFTDGTDTGGSRASQGDIDIFRNVSQNAWALFFDDGGPAGGQDDNDYNDMVVKVSQAAAVPEPGTLGLIGLGLLGVAAFWRRKDKKAMMGTKLSIA